MGLSIGILISVVALWLVNFEGGASRLVTSAQCYCDHAEMRMSERAIWNVVPINRISPEKDGSVTDAKFLNVSHWNENQDAGQFCSGSERYIEVFRQLILGFAEIGFCAGRIPLHRNPIFHLSGWSASEVFPTKPTLAPGAGLSGFVGSALKCGKYKICWKLT